MAPGDEERIRQALVAHQGGVARFFETGTDTVIGIADRLAAALAGGGRIFWFGNGGSAAEAQHFAGELVGGMGDARQGLAAIALTADAAVVTGLANDTGFREVFARQIAALGRTGDVAVGLTTSGRSANVVAGLRAAREGGLGTVLLTGPEGGPAEEWADRVCRVPGDGAARIQEVHQLIGHLVCELVFDRIGRASAG